MKKIYLVRHGQSLANVDRFAAKGSLPDHAIPLTELGEQQADAAGPALLEILKKDRVSRARMWVSPYKRTRDTADRVLSALDRNYVYVDKKEHINLCEQQFGLFDNVPDEELPKVFPLEHAHYDLAEKHAGRFWPRMPLGESRFDVAVRVHQAFPDFKEDRVQEGIENIIVVCHGVVLRAFVMQWLHLPYEWMDTQRNPGNCDIYRISQEKAFGELHTEHGFVYKNGILIQE